MVFRMPSEKMKEKVRSGKLTVLVFGLGHVGLPVVVAWLRAGAKVLGCDVNKEVVNRINRGESPIPDEPGLQEMVAETYWPWTACMEEHTTSDWEGLEKPTSNQVENHKRSP